MILILIQVPCLYLSNNSQMPLRAYGSTPAVGSSRITTLDPPTNAMATDNFLCMPPLYITKMSESSIQSQYVTVNSDLKFMLTFKEQFNKITFKIE